MEVGGGCGAKGRGGVAVVVFAYCEGYGDRIACWRYKDDDFAAGGDVFFALAGSKQEYTSAQEKGNEFICFHN